MALHQSEVIMYAQMDTQLRLRVRALIAKQNVAAGKAPDPETDLDRIMWRIAVDPTTLTFLGGDFTDQAAVSAKIATAADSALLGVINAALAQL